MVVVGELPWRRCLAFLLSALLPPACYTAIAMAARASCITSHAFISSSFLAVALVLLVCGLRQSLCAQVPAYVPVVGHFVTAVLTLLVKLLPVVSAGLSAMFLGFSVALSFLLARMISSDPGRMASSSCDKVDGPWREGECTDDDSHCSAQFISRDLLEKGGGMNCENMLIEETYECRGKYCHHCHAFIERYDHHCAAVQNCIGRKNHGVFLIMLVAFSLAEISYVSCCISYLRPFLRSTPQMKKTDDNNLSSNGFLYTFWEIFCREAWVLSTACFVGFQVLWQIPLLIFQAYLTANNLTSDEWINWESYSKFCKEGSPSHGSIYQRKKFVNPYDLGFVSNLHAMLQKWK